MSAGHLESRWTGVDGLRLHAKRSLDPISAGRLPVVFVHGLLVSMRYMLAAAVRLAPRFPVHILDLPGYGRSDRPSATPDVPRLSAVVDGWMGAIGLERAAVIANSFGCQIATDLAVRHPGRVARLVLIGPTIDPFRHSAWQQACSLLLDGTREPPRYARLLAADIRDMGLPLALRMSRMALRDRIEERLPLVVVPGAAHVAHYDAVDRFVDLVAPFLAQAT